MVGLQVRELKSRKQIWQAISEFYLDTELKEKDYQRIFGIFKNSGKSLEELKQIDLYEVFPALRWNLRSVAGEWAGFDEKFLVEVCSKNYHRRKSKWFRLITQLRNRGSYGLQKSHWEKVEDLFMSMSQ